MLAILIGIFFGINDKRNVSERIEGKQTNNTAELLAIIKTYPLIKQDILNDKNVMIISDSNYAINNWNEKQSSPKRKHFMY